MIIFLFYSFGCWAIALSLIWVGWLLFLSVSSPFFKFIFTLVVKGEVSAYCIAFVSLELFFTNLKHKPLLDIPFSCHLRNNLWKVILHMEFLLPVKLLIMTYITLKLKYFGCEYSAFNHLGSWSSTRIQLL